jgi:hypothetical protein
LSASGVCRQRTEWFSICDQDSEGSLVAGQDVVKIDDETEACTDAPIPSRAETPRPTRPAKRDAQIDARPSG